MNQFFSQNNLKQIGKMLILSGKDFLNDNAPQWAAAISYYGLLSIFPLLLAAAAIAAFFVDQTWAVQQATSLIGKFLPGGAGQIRNIVQGAIQARGTVSILSIITLGWSGSRVFGVVTKALNIAYDTDEPYGFFKRVLVELLMVVTIGVLFILAVSSRFLIDFVTSLVNLPGLAGTWWWIALQYAIRITLLVVSVFLIYQYVPRRNVKWWASLIGSIVFTILFLVIQPLFTGYISRFANYNLIYGPLAIVIILVLWTWIVANLLLLGGEIVSHIQDMLVEQKPGKEVEERHAQSDPTNPKHKQLKRT